MRVEDLAGWNAFGCDGDWAVDGGGGFMERTGSVPVGGASIGFWWRTVR